MTEANQIALLGFVLDTLDFGVTLLREHLAFHNRLFQDRRAHLYRFFVSGEQHLERHGITDFLFQLFNLHFLTLGNLVLLSAGSDNREHMPKYESFKYLSTIRDFPFTVKWAAALPRSIDKFPIQVYNIPLDH